MLEAPIEAACCKHALRRGCLPIKLQCGVTGDPDRGFILPGHIIWLVEFKRTGVTRLRPRQRVRHAELAALGIHVEVINSTAEFKAMLDVYLQATA